MIHNTMMFFLLIFSFLSSFNESNGDSPPNITLPYPHMVIVGPTGSGKSSLAMALIGEDVECENCTFPICWDSDSCTKETSYATAPWLGNPENQNFSVVDTPGFGDSDGETDELLEEMITVLNEEVKSANAIILAMDSQQCRWTESLTKMLHQLEGLFGRKMWNNTIIEMTKFSYDEDDIEEREYECQKPQPNHCQNETYWYNEMNRQLEEKFHIGMELPVVFIDSWSQKESNKDEPSEQEHFFEETKKLWDFAMSHDRFDFKSIDEVLEENEALRIENEWLKDEVTKNITELQEMLTQETYERKMNDGTLTDNVANVELELSGNVTAIQKNVTKQINEVYAELDNDYTEVQDEISELQNDIEQLHNSPIGSIVAWITKPEDSSSQESVLPDGWLECDGRIINEPSIWAGSHTPNLNGEKRFLRGGDYTSQRRMEADTFQDHKHTDKGHTHTDQGHSHSYGDYVTSFRDNYCPDEDGHNGPEGIDDRDERFDCDVSRTSLSSTAQLSIDMSGVENVADEYRHGSETRPVNMNVIWIMRVW